MDERIDILNKNGKATGKTALKSLVHTNGYYHNTAHIWFYTKAKEILLTQRSASKVICPLLWDVSVAGHVDSGETVKQAAIRETEEELGIIINGDQLYKIGVYECFQKYPNGIIDNEFHHTYIAQLKVDLHNIAFNTFEVEAVQLVSFLKFEELLKQSHSSNYFVASNIDYYKIVLSNIKEATKI